MVDTRVGVRKRCRLRRSNLEAVWGRRHRHRGRSFGTPGLCPGYNLNQVTLITMVTVWEIQISATVFASQFVTRGQVVQSGLERPRQRREYDKNTPRIGASGAE